MMNKCPICNGNLIRQVNNFIRIVMDGNSVFQCENEKNHRFWRHPFSYNILHFHPNSSICHCEWFKAWKYDKNGNIIEILVNEEKIGSVI